MIKLGLPLEYQKLPEFFDAHNILDDGDWSSEKVNAVIERILDQFGIKSVLDMTCGTGSQVFYLKERGYNVVGSDFSPPLLEIARNKAEKLNYNLQFIDGDMRTIKVEKFDSVITIFNAVGHLSKDDFSLAMENINSNLSLNGIYIFDIFNLQAMTDAVIANFAYQVKKKSGDFQLLSSQASTIDRENALLTSYDHIMVQKGAEKPDMYENIFSLQIYKLEDLKEMLQHAGFETVSVYDINGSEFKKETSISMLLVAKKISELT